MNQCTICFILFFAGSAATQYQDPKAAIPPFPWPLGKQAAVSLTFDDARPSQIETGVPLLNRYGVKATFYISPENFIERIAGWRAASATGHEIGNHTLSHPCTGNYAFSRENALEHYTLSRIEQELDGATKLISDSLGLLPVSFAYPCGQTFVGRGAGLQSYVPLVAQKFTTGRGWLGEAANDPWLCDPALLLAMESDNKSFEYLRGLVEQAAQENRWLILAGHEIGPEGHQTTSSSALEQLCIYLQDASSGIWIDTVGAIAAHMRTVRASQHANGPNQ